MAERQVATACPQLEQEVVLYHYGELDGAEHSRIQAHIEACDGCRLYLKQIKSILPLTGATDEPPDGFWSAYSREMRQKLAEIDERQPRWGRLGGFLGPWSVPAMATTVVIVIALVFTLGKGLMRRSDIPMTDEALMEALPVAEKLDFFTNMELLDSLELLELTGGGNGEV